nr:hypothetical protein [Saprospiraceae bacterium]
IIVFVVFMIFYFLDTYSIKNQLSHKYIKASLVFGLISCIGTFVLAYNMMTKNYDQTQYLASVYWYLHFQYNGWFLFSIFGLMHHLFERRDIILPFQNMIFWLLVLSCLPTYGLSVLWLKLPIVLYIFTVVAALVQWGAWLILGKNLLTFPSLWSQYNSLNKLLLWVVGLAFTFKITLQLVSVHPALSQLAFGYRNIVIAYLHLCLLAITTVFLFAYGKINHMLHTTTLVDKSLKSIVFLIVTTEVILGVQGVLSLSYTNLPLFKEMMFGASLLLSITALTLLIGHYRKSSNI